MSLWRVKKTGAHGKKAKNILYSWKVNVLPKYFQGHRIVHRIRSYLVHSFIRSRIITEKSILFNTNKNKSLSSVYKANNKRTWSICSICFRVHIWVTSQKADTCSKATKETLLKRYKICSKLIIKVPERRQRLYCLLLTLDIFHTFHTYLTFNRLIFTRLLVMNLAY